MKNYLFVYGTLLDEYAPPEVAETVRRLEYVGDGFVRGRLYDLGEYPGAVLDGAARTKIYGRVYLLPDDADVLEKLDDYEEFHPHDESSQDIFVRRETVVFLRDGRKLRGWIYEYNRAVKSSALIESGDYSKIAV